MRKIRGDEDEALKHCEKCLAWYSPEYAKVGGHICDPLMAFLLKGKRKLKKKVKAWKGRGKD